MAACGLLGCGPGGADSGSSEPPPTPLVFTDHGLPGPWWRIGGSPRDFQRDARRCRLESTGARKRATSNELDVAYRAFIGCMERRRWKRGLPPNEPRA